MAIAQQEQSLKESPADALLEHIASVGFVLSALLHLAFTSRSALAGALTVVATLSLSRSMLCRI